MRNYAQKYKYGVLDEIVCFRPHKNYIVIITKTSMYCFDTNSKRRIYCITHNLQISRVLIFREKMFFLGPNCLYNLNLEIIRTLKPSTAVLVTEDWLLLADDESYTFFDTMYFRSYYHNIKDEGYCTACTIFDEKLILSFESGKLYAIAVNLLFVLPETRSLAFYEYFDFSETILDIAVLKFQKEIYEDFTSKLVVSLLNKEIVLLSPDKTIITTALNCEVQSIYCRANFIFLLDMKNNLIFMNERLKALDVLQNVKGVDVVNRDLYIAMESKVVVEYKDYNWEVAEERHSMYDRI